jgi:hypothetical protein
VAPIAIGPQRDLSHSDRDCLGFAFTTSGPSSIADRVPGTRMAGPKTAAEWFNTVAFAVTTVGDFVNADIGSILGSSLIEFDMALHKDFKTKERNSFEFRSEFFNIFSHTNFAGVLTAVGTSNFSHLTSARP